MQLCLLQRAIEKWWISNFNVNKESLRVLINADYKAPPREVWVIRSGSIFLSYLFEELPWKFWHKQSVNHTLCNNDVEIWNRIMYAITNPWENIFLPTLTPHYRFILITLKYPLCAQLNISKNLDFFHPICVHLYWCICSYNARLEKICICIFYKTNTITLEYVLITQEIILNS